MKHLLKKQKSYVKAENSQAINKLMLNYVQSKNFKGFADTLSKKADVNAFMASDVALVLELALLTRQWKVIELAVAVGAKFTADYAHRLAIMKPKLASDILEQSDEW